MGETCTYISKKHRSCKFLVKVLSEGGSQESIVSFFLKETSLLFFLRFYLFIHERQRERETEREREAETQAEGEEGSMQGAQCGT